MKKGKPIQEYVAELVTTVDNWCFILSDLLRTLMKFIF